MPRSRFLLALFTFVLLFNGRQRAVQHPTAWPSHGAPADAFTYSEPANVTTQHLLLDLTVDFEARQLRGRATLEIDNRAATRTLILDTYELAIERVLLDHTTPAIWSLGNSTRVGAPLSIEIEPNTRFVTIDYATSTTAGPIRDSFGPVLNWTEPHETFGGQEPYLYTINAPIGARSWLPVQDTPTVRMSFDATLRVPRGMLALMTARGNPTIANDTGVYVFHMPEALPSYLIALAVGRLEFHAFDERTGVYAEPELIDDAAWELQSMPAMLEAAEQIVGAFPFARHDVLLMPPTFFVDGMEHPMLNFLRPTSAVGGHHPEQPLPKDLLAHELAHSWAGDATTLANWNDIWLNEGFATYLAHRILETMQSDEQTELVWQQDRQNYEDHLRRAAPSSTILHRQVAAPIDGWTQTGYLKGALFLRTLEQRAGREAFDEFLRRYFASTRWWWVDDLKFSALFRRVVQPPIALESELRLEEWLYGTGLPSNVTAPATSTLRTRAEQRAAAFRDGTPIAQLAPHAWSDTETTLFLQLASPQVRTRMAEVDAALALSQRDTPPFSWLTDSIAARYEPGLAAVERVMLRGAPFTWIPTLYTRLTAIDRPRAQSIFQRGRDQYYPLLEQEVAAIVGATAAKAPRVRPAA